MKRLALKIAFFLLGLIILLNILGFLADRVAPLGFLYHDAEQGYQSLLTRREQIEAISIGNSHSAAIDFETLGVEGQVLTRAGADLFEVERYINTISAELPNLKTVFIALSYYSFSRDNVTVNNMQILRIELYTMLPIWRPIKGDGDNLVLGKLHRVSRLMSVARPDHWQPIIRPEGGYAELLASLFKTAEVTDSSDPPCFHLSPEEMESHAQEIASKNVSSTQTMASLHPQLQTDTLAILAKTIADLQKQNIAVVLYTPPYQAAYTAHFMEEGADIVEQMHTAVAQLQAEYHVPYYDFSHDPDIITQPTLFFNSDHLNQCGSIRFTERLRQSMQTAGPKELR